MDRYTETLTWTLNQLDKDHELTEFVAGIPGLYESKVFFSLDNTDGLRNIRPVLAVLPGPKSFDAPLPWSIIWLAKRAIAGELPKPIQQKRTRACLKALYYIPGAIHDLLASFAARKHYCLEILPLLNSPESLEIIEELWDSPNDDVALSVRCAEAIVAAFMITPPRHTLDTFLTSTVGFIGDNSAGEQFLAKRLHVGPNMVGDVAPEFHPNSDTARLQNIVRFLADIQDTLFYMNTQWWASESAESARRQRQELYDKRHTEEYGLGQGMFDQQGNRSNSAFIRAAQQDLIVLTLEILARDPVADAATSQREAFDDICTMLGQVTRAQARRRIPQPHVVLHAREILEEVALRGVQAADSIGLVKNALEPVFHSLKQSQNTTPHADPPQMPVPQIVTPTPAQIFSTNDTPGPGQAQPAQRSQLPPIQAPPYMFQYSLPSSAGIATAAADLDNSPVCGSQVPFVE